MKKIDIGDATELRKKEQEKIAKELLNLNINESLKILLKNTFPNIED